MASITKVRSMITAAMETQREASWRHLVTVKEDGNWRDKSCNLSDDAWQALLFALENDPTVEYIDVITKTVALIKRKAEKKAPGSK